MEGRRRSYLLGATLYLSIAAVWALSEFTLEDGTEHISGGGAVLYFALGLFCLGLVVSPRVREFRDSIAETTVVQSAAFVIGLLLLLVASITVYDVLRLAESESVGYYFGSAVLLFICGVGGGSIVYASGHTLFARVMD